MPESPVLEILIAEDEPDISMQYQIVLEERGHKVKITENGEDCLKAYLAALDQKRQAAGASCDDEKPFSEISPPFDAVILDYRMPKKDGLVVAKEVLKLCPSQRVMFASAYTAETLIEAVKVLHKVVELLQKPFDLEYFVDAVEDKALYEQLERLNTRVRDLKDHDVTHSQLVDLLAGVTKLQNMAMHK
jgi:CheY-like chemotaxis protein